MQSAREKRQEQVQLLCRTVQSRAEGLILAIGLALAIGLCLFLLLLLPWQAEASHHLFRLSILHIISGRAAGISYGYSVWPQGSWIVIPINMYLETVIVFLAYPIFVFSLENFGIFRFAQAQSVQIRTAAERHSRWVKRFGMIGLFTFVWLPFWMTGPLVGCIIGYLLHLRVRFNLGIVLAGTYVAIICWSLFLKELQQRLQEYSVYAPVIIVSAVVLFSMSLHIAYRIRRSRSNSD